MVLTPQSAIPRCTATVVLISRVFRPWLFMVTVVGEPPHAVTRRYKVAAPDDNAAAFCGIGEFVKEFTPKVIADEMAPLAPKAVLQ